MAPESLKDAASVVDEHADTDTRWAGVRGAEATAEGRGAGRRTVIVGALIVLAAMVLTVSVRSESELHFELRGASNEGGVIEAKRGEATVSLSDGSSILAENQTRFSVQVVGPRAALTTLFNGKLHVRVQHDDGTSYRFNAGPYQINVVGTEFDVAWDPTGAGLSLMMSKGEVQVVSPGGQLRTLSAGSTLLLPAEPMP